MALINCPECGRQISDRAPSCPGCGILKEDIQAMIAEKNATHSSKEGKKISHNNDVVESQGTEEELVGYPTISAISETEKKRYSEKHETKRQKAEQIVKTGRAERKFDVGEITTLGTQKGKPIRWIVLETKGDDMLLLSEKCLEVRQYHLVNRAVTWETSDIRRYLNGEFLEKNFSDQERQMIKHTALFNYDNLKYATKGYVAKGGNSTLDRVFLLSIDEEKKYFPDHRYRSCEASKYAIKQAKQVKGWNNLVAEDGTIQTNRWLRSPGCFQDSAANVLGAEEESRLNEGGYPVDWQLMIRPALVVHLDE